MARIVNGFRSSKALVVRYIRRCLEARQRRLEHDREFYRNLNDFCRANNMSPICEDDWKAGA